VKLPPTLFFTITQNAGSFIMKQIASVRPPGCAGEAAPYELAGSNLKLEL